MALLLASPYFVAVALLMLGWLRASKHVSLAHLPLLGVPLLLPPSGAMTADLFKADSSPSSSSSAAPSASSSSTRPLKRMSGKKKARAAAASLPRGVTPSGDLELVAQQVTDGCLSPLPQYALYDGLVFAGALALCVLLFAELWSSLVPGDASAWPEWAGSLAVAYAAYTAARLAALTGACGYEARLSAAFGTLAAVVAYLLLTMAPRWADTELAAPHAAFLAQLNARLEAQGSEARLTLGARATAAAVAAAAGAGAGLLFMPAMKLARGLESVDAGVLGALDGGPPWVRERGPALARAAFFAPLAVSLLWVAPLTKDAVVHDGTSLTAGAYDGWRVLAAVAAGALRVGTLRVHVTAHSVAPTQTGERPPGLWRSLVWAVNTVPVAAAQHLAPALASLLLPLVYKRAAGMSWGVAELALGATATPAAATATLSPFRNALAAPVLSFAVFWCNFSFFAASVLSVFYVRYLRGAGAASHRAATKIR